MTFRFAFALCFALTGGANFFPTSSLLAQDAPLTGLPNVIYTTTQHDGSGSVCRLNNDGSALTVRAALDGQIGLSSSQDNNVYLIAGGGESTLTGGGGQTLYQLALSTAGIGDWGTFSSQDALAVAANNYNSTLAFVLTTSNGIVAVHNDSDHTHEVIVPNNLFPFTPYSLCLDPGTNFYVSGSTQDGTNYIAVAKPHGRTWAVTVIDSGLVQPLSLAAASDGSGVFYADINGNIHKVASDGSSDLIVCGTAGLNMLPDALATDVKGNLYFGGPSYALSNGTVNLSVVYRYEPDTGGLFALTPNGVSGLLTDITVAGPVAGGTNLGVTVGVMVTQYSTSNDVPNLLTVTRTGDATGKIKVGYTVSGAAVEGIDYAPLSGVAKLKANKTSSTITVTPEGNSTTLKKVKLKLTAGTAYRIDPANKMVNFYVGND